MPLIRRPDGISRTSCRYLNPSSGCVRRIKPRLPRVTRKSSSRGWPPNPRPNLHVIGLWDDLSCGSVPRLRDRGWPEAVNVRPGPAILQREVERSSLFHFAFCPNSATVAVNDTLNGG